MVNFWCLFARTFCMRSPPEWEMCERSLKPVYFEGCPKCSSHLHLNTSSDQRAHYLSKKSIFFKQHLHLGHVHSHLQALPMECLLPETLPSPPSANTQSSHPSPHTLETFFPLNTILFSLEFIQQHLLTPTTCQALF